MACIDSKGFFYPFKTDLRKLILIKCRTESICKTCNKIIPTKSFCLGKSGSWWWNRCCLNCSKIFLNNFINSIENFKKIGVEVLKDIKKNEKEYQTINSVANI